MRETGLYGHSGRPLHGDIADGRKEQSSQPEIVSQAIGLHDRMQLPQLCCDDCSLIGLQADLAALILDRFDDATVA